MIFSYSRVNRLYIFNLRFSLFVRYCLFKNFEIISEFVCSYGFSYTIFTIPLAIKFLNIHYKALVLHK